MNMFDANIYNEMFGDKIHSTEIMSDDTMEYKIYTQNQMHDANNGMTAMTPFPKNTSVAMAYIPYQQWESPYSDSVALDRGTLFPCLDKPFIGEEAVRNGYKR